jgi:aminomethyltransferase
VWRDNTEVGHVTSAAFSPACERVIALGYVHRDLATPGTPVLVSADGDKLPAVISRVIEG